MMPCQSRAGMLALTFALALPGGLALSSGPARSGTVQALPLPDAQTLAANAAKRFPQPVRVGDLIGRNVLQPTEAQPVLGRVAGLVRDPDGALAMIVRLGPVLGGLLPLGARPVAVPLDAVALLGEHVAVIDLSPDQLRALPTAGAALAAVPPDETVRVGLVRPFH